MGKWGWWCGQGWGYGVDSALGPGGPIVAPVHGDLHMVEQDHVNQPSHGRDHSPLLVRSIAADEAHDATVIAKVFLDEELSLSDQQLLVRVSVSGELCRESVEDVVSALRQCRNAGADLVVDLSGVTFIDAGGISALVDEWGNCRADGCDMLIVDPSRAVARLLAILRLDLLLGRKRSTDATSSASMN